jgi:hypothetical protein
MRRGLSRLHFLGSKVSYDYSFLLGQDKEGAGPHIARDDPDLEPVTTGKVSAFIPGQVDSLTVLLPACTKKVHTPGYGYAVQ